MIPGAKSLALRTALPVAGALLLAGLLALGTANGIARRWEAGRQRETVEAMVAVAAPSASAACFGNDAPMGDQVVQGLVASPGVCAATLRAHGAILAQAVRKGAPPSGTKLATVSRKLGSPFDPAAQVGDLVLTIDPVASLRQGTRATSLFLGGLVTLALALGLALALALQLAIALPLRSLTHRLEDLDPGPTEGAGSPPDWDRLVQPPLGHEGDELGNLAAAVRGLGQRITAARLEERQRNESLSQDQRRIQAILDSADAGIFVLGSDGVLTTWTPALLRLLGLEHLQLQPGTRLASLLGAEAPQVEHCLSQCQAEAAPARTVLRVPDPKAPLGHRWLKLALKPVGPDWIQGLLEDLPPSFAAGMAEDAANNS